MNHVGKNILQAMDKKGFSYGKLSKETGIGKTTLQGYATGRTKKIPSDNLNAISIALDVDPKDLLGWDRDADLVVANEMRFPKEAIDTLRRWQGMTDPYTGATMTDLLSVLIQNPMFESMLLHILKFQNKDYKWWQEMQRDLQAHGEDISSPEAAKQFIYTEIIGLFGNTLTKITTESIPTYHHVEKKKDRITIRMRDKNKVICRLANRAMYPDDDHDIEFVGRYWTEEKKTAFLEGLIAGLDE